MCIQLQITKYELQIKNTSKPKASFRNSYYLLKDALLKVL